MISEHDRGTLPPEQATIPPDHSWNRMPVIGAVCAVLGAAACAILGAANPKQFFFSWLVSFLFFLSLSLGALFFVLIQYASQGGWGIVVRRIGETVFVTIPVMAALFLPLLLGLHDLYEWTHHEAVAEDAVLQWKAPFLNVPFFLIRALIYFGIWSFIAVLYYKGSRRQDETGDPAISARLRRFAGPSIIVLAITSTFASIDWIMSLTPHWYSTMFGVYFFAGSFVGFIALLSVVAAAMRRAGLLDTVITAEHLHDVGKLLFAFTSFWAYIAFSQFFLIWYANLPEETPWFIVRQQGPWLFVSFLLLFGHFCGPFLFLISRWQKRNKTTLLPGAIWMLAMHWIDMFWLVFPHAASYSDAGPAGRVAAALCRPQGIRHAEILRRRPGGYDRFRLVHLRQLGHRPLRRQDALLGAALPLRVHAQLRRHDHPADESLAQSDFWQSNSLLRQVRVERDRHHVPELVALAELRGDAVAGHEHPAPVRACRQRRRVIRPPAVIGRHPRLALVVNPGEHAIKRPRVKRPTGCRRASGKAPDPTYSSDRPSSSSPCSVRRSP